MAKSECHISEHIFSKHITVTLLPQVHCLMNISMYYIHVIQTLKTEIRGFNFKLAILKNGMVLFTFFAVLIITIT